MSIQFRLESDRLKSLPDAVGIFLFDKIDRLPKSYGVLDRQMGGMLSEAIKRPELSGGRELVQVLYPSKGPRRLFIARLGERDRFEGNQIRTAAAKLIQAATPAQVRRLHVVLPGDMKGMMSDLSAARAIADGFSIGSYRFDDYHGAASSRTTSGGNTHFIIRIADRFHTSVREQLTIGRCVAEARRLAATPPNIANTSYISRTCRKMARDCGLKYRLINAKQAKELGLNGLLAVGGAGSQPPALICLEHRGKSRQGQGPVMLVGKGITFDTGGYSLKSDGGRNMKYDKCGAMSVIGAMQAIALLKLPQHVVGLIPCAENMIDHNAYRVDDIITFCNGVTVEVTNTDAEGRLVLADALAWGTKQYQPSAVIDLATLTGGVVVALGSFCAGMFCNNTVLHGKLTSAAEETGEKLWPLPLWQEHRAMMKGTSADLVNSADRKAHPIQGAAFLSHFVGPDAPRRMPEIPWAHIDIAGMADVDSDTPLHSKGPTGFGIRLLVETIKRF